MWDALGTHPDHFLIFLVRSNHCEAELGDVKEIASEVAMDVRAVDEGRRRAATRRTTSEIKSKR